MLQSHNFSSVFLTAKVESGKGFNLQLLCFLFVVRERGINNVKEI